MLPKKVWISWSTGKDSAYSAYLLRQQTEVELTGLLTTVTANFDRVAMHAVRVELLKKQAAAMKLPLEIIFIPSPCSNEIYAEKMKAAIATAKQAGVTHMAFGDLFLEDIRVYRETMLMGTGIEPLFPLWGRDTKKLANDMIRSGLKARITCVDPRQLAKTFVGREFNYDFLNDLPPTVDPCGERGEFHTFVYDGPMFSEPIPVKLGEVVERDGFIFADLDT